MSNAPPSWLALLVLIGCSVALVVALLLVHASPVCPEVRGVYAGLFEENGQRYLKEKLPNGNIILRVHPKRY